MEKERRFQKRCIRQRILILLDHVSSVVYHCTSVCVFITIIIHSSFKNLSRAATINSRWVVLEEQDETPEQCWEAPEKEVGVPDLMDEEGGTYVDGEAEEEHLPVGQHLLLDIRHVDSSFLSSEERLAKAMLEVVNECGLTLLSYHCHRLKTAGVSCVGVLLESHVSFHTWPSQGVIIFDLFTCGSNSLLPVISTAEKFFGVQQEVTDPKKPETVWAYKARGFGSDDKDEIASLTDLFTFPIGTMADYKKHVSWNCLFVFDSIFEEMMIHLSFFHTGIVNLYNPRPTG